MTRRSVFALPLFAAVTLLCVIATPSAQRRRGGGEDAGVPLTTSMILENPEAFYGKTVTVSAGVEQVVTKTAFTVDQRKMVGSGTVQPIGKPVLVIAPYLTGVLDPKHYLLMRGEIQKLDLGLVARLSADFTLELTADVFQKYQGQPVLLANSVLSSTYAEMARKPLPPKGPTEQSIDAAMKNIAPAFAALRAAVQASDSRAVTDNVTKLKPAFAQTVAAWYDMGVVAAAQWAQEALELSETIEREAAAGHWDIVNLSAGALNQKCQSCHGIYRERQEDGVYRITPGSY